MKKKVNERVDLTAGIEVVAVTKGLESKSKAAPSADLGEGEIDVVVSNATLDRHGEKIVVNGIDTSQIKRNPTVLWAHEYSDLSIGKITKLWKDAGNLMARIHFAYDIYEFANTVYQMVLGGYINAVSIGGIVREWNDDFTVIKQLEMVELSVVPVGANPDALVMAKSAFKKSDFESIGISRSEFKKQYSDALSKAAALDKVSRLSENDRNKYLVNLKELVGMLEGAKPAEHIDAKDEQPTIRRVILSSKQ